MQKQLMNNNRIVLSLGKDSRDNQGRPGFLRLQFDVACYKIIILKKLKKQLIL